MVNRVEKEPNTCKIHEVLKDLFMLIVFLLLFGLPYCFIPCSETVIIDESEQVIKIQRHFIFKNDEHIQISFDTIEHVVYRSDVWLDVPTVTVEVVKIDGTKIEIETGIQYRELRDLAESIAKTSQKQLKEEWIT